MITTDDGVRRGAAALLWARCLDAADWLIGRNWRRVFTLALGVLALGVLLVAVSDDQVWDDVGTGLVGGSVVGLVFAIAQHTLDLQAVERQVAQEVRLTVSSAADLEGIDLAGAELSAVHLFRKRLRHAHMDGARLVGADLRASDLTWASLRGADLRRADLRGSRLAHAVLDAADLSGAELSAAGLTDARLVGANLTGARLEPGPLAPGGAEPGPAALPGGPVTDAAAGSEAVAAGEADAGDGDGAGAVHGGAGEAVAARWADLSAATLDDARLSRAALPDLRASFLSARRADAAGAVLRRADLSCADLRGASLSGADLRDADLRGADLRGAVMSRADLRGARLAGARLEGADLTGAVVAGADLSGADLRGAYLTNVDLAACRLDGARVRAEDLERAETRPDPAVLGRGESAVGGAAGPVGRLVLVAPEALGGVAEAVASHLRARRSGLRRLNGDLDRIHLREEHPYAGDPADHGLPRSVAVARDRPPRRARAWAELRPAGPAAGRSPGPAAGPPAAPAETAPAAASPAAASPTAASPAAAALAPEASDAPPGAGAAAGRVEVVVHVAGRAAVVAGAEPWPGADAGRLASAVQAQLADPEVFADAGEVHAFARWLERPAQPAGPALAEVLRRNPRNPLALLLQAFDRESSDVRDMLRASDEVRTVWAVGAPGPVRALAATRLAWAQGQVLHRATDSALVLARARAAADAAVREFDRLGRRWRPARRVLVLRTKAELAWSLAWGVTERPDDLGAAIARLRRWARVLERRRLAVPPRLRNTLAYWLMAAAGRFTPGPGARYTEAIAHLRALLAHYGLREEGDPVDGSGRRATVSVRTLARRAAAGEGPPTDRLLRERSLRLGLVNLGNMHRLEKRFDAALDCLGAALYCDPDYVEAYAERAWVHLDRADPEAAEADIRRALDRQVGTPEQKARVLVGYAEALERVGLVGEQGRWLEEARRLAPTSPRVRALARRWEERARAGG